MSTCIVLYFREKYGLSWLCPRLHGGSDAVTTVFSALAQRFADRFGLALRVPPLDDLDLNMVLVTSGIRAHDPLLVWIADQVRMDAEGVFDPVV